MVKLSVVFLCGLMIAIWLIQTPPQKVDAKESSKKSVDQQVTKGSHSPKSQDLRATIDAYLQTYVESHNFSGTVLLASRNNILVNKGYGMAVYRHSVPNAAGTKFQIASVSKSFTAAAILLLHESGQLQLKDSVSRFVPDFPKGEEITIQHLLTHTSGLPRYVFFLAPIKDAFLFICCLVASSFSSLSAVWALVLSFSNFV